MQQEVNIQKAMDYMRDNAPRYAEAKASRVYLDQFRKSKKAMLIMQTTGTVQERESFAYSHPEYIEVLEGLKAAIEIEEEIRWRMEAAKIKAEVWRTQQANNRRIDGAHQ